MRKTALSKIAVIGVVLCALLFCPLAAFAADSAPSWVTPEDREMHLGDVTYYSSPDGTSSAEITGYDITWLYASVGRYSLCFGVDNAKGIFQVGSRFHVRMIVREEDIAEYDEILSQMDESSKSRINMNDLILIVAGVDAPDGTAYIAFPETVPLYVQLSDSMDKSGIVSMFIGNGEDEPIATNIQFMQFPEGRAAFARAEMRHFGEPLVISQERSFAASVFAEYKPVILWGGVVAVAAALIAVTVISRKKKHREENAR